MGSSPVRSPSITVPPSIALYGKTFSAQSLDTVRMPAKNAVGAVNDGRKVITDAPASGVLMIGATRTARIQRAFDHLTEFLKTAAVDGKVPLREAVMDKLFASELRERSAGAHTTSSAPAASARRRRRRAGRQKEYVLREAIVALIGCGTTEMQRNVIAQRAWSCPVEQGAVYE
jgi:alkylation response protein AidB-like acyl-CoA dehydrogenase